MRLLGEKIRRSLVLVNLPLKSQVVLTFQQLVPIIPKRLGDLSFRPETNLHRGNMKNQGKDLKSAFDSMCHQLVVLHAHWNTFSELFHKSGERADLLRHTAPNFFGIARNMMLDHIELTIAKFGDPKTSKSKRGSKENLTLEQICSIVAEEDPVLCRLLEAPMARYKEQCDAIKAHRNSRIAHFDYQTYVNPKLSPLPDVTRPAIESAIAELDLFLNQVSEILGEKIETESLRLETEYFFDPVISDNVDALVCFLAFGLRYDELRRAGKIPISDIDESKYWKA